MGWRERLGTPIVASPPTATRRCARGPWVGVAAFSSKPVTGDALPGAVHSVLGKRRILDAFDRQDLIRLMTDWRGNVSGAAPVRPARSAVTWASA